MMPDTAPITPETPETALIKINPLTDAAVARLKVEAESLMAAAEKAVVTNNSEERSVINDLTIVALTKRAIEKCQYAYVHPITEYHKKLLADFGSFTEPLLKADRVLRGKLQDYRAEQQRKLDEVKRINDLREEAARREAAMNGGEISQPVNLVVEPPAPPKTVHADIGSAGTQKVWKFEVEDVEKLPREYMVPDLVKIGKVVRAGVAVPGVKAWQEDSIRINARGGA